MLQRPGLTVEEELSLGHICALPEKRIEMVTNALRRVQAISDIWYLFEN